MSGRSYAFAVDGFLFQAPVSYYSSVGRWDLSPGYAGKQNIELAKPIEEPCLYCHASRAQPVAKTQNRYLDPPFLEGGVGCERCHGSGQKHVTDASRHRESGETRCGPPGQHLPAVPSDGSGESAPAGPRSGNVSPGRSALRSPDRLCMGAGERRACGNRPFRTTRQEQVQVGVGRPHVVRHLPRSAFHAGCCGPRCLLPHGPASAVMRGKGAPERGRAGRRGR